MIKGQVKSMHFIVEGKFIVNIARQKYWFEDDEDNAIKLLEDGFVGLTTEKIMRLISGDSIVDGYSICNDKKCEQCKGLSSLCYKEIEDKEFKKEIQKRTKWLAKNYFKSGQFHIQKKDVMDYLVQKRVVEFLEKHADISFGQERESLKAIYNNMFHGSCLKPIEYDSVPEPTSRSYKFAIALQSLIKNFVPTDEEKDDIEIEVKGRIKECQIIYVDKYNDTHFSMIVGQLTEAKQPKDISEQEPKQQDYPCEIPYDGVIHKLGKFYLEKRFLDDYANEVRFNRSSMMLAMYGVMDDENLKHPLAKRIAKHRRIYESIGLIYHADLHDMNKMQDRERNQVDEDVWDLTHLIDEYVVKKHPEVDIAAMTDAAKDAERRNKFIEDYMKKSNSGSKKKEKKN